MYQEGVKVVAIPKTMDNDVPGTDYCIGFSTCVTRTIELANSLRTVAARMNELWCWKSLEDTPGLPPCSRPWQARPIVV